MNSRLPSPCFDSPNSPGAGNGRNDPSVPGFVFLSQPQFNKRPNYSHNQHGSMGSFPGFHESNGTYRGRGRNNFESMRGGNSPRFNNSPRGNFSSCGSSSPRGNFDQQRGSYTPRGKYNYQDNYTPRGKSSPQYSQNGSFVGSDISSPYGRNLSFQSTPQHSTPQRGSPGGSPFNSSRGRGRGRGGHNTPLSEVPIDKFVSASVLEDPWTEVDISSRMRQKLQEEDDECDCDQGAPKETENSMETDQQKVSSSDDNKNIEEINCKDTIDESNSSFVESWQ